MDATLMEGAEIAVWHWDPTSSQLTWQPPMRRMLGMASARDPDIDHALRELIEPVLTAPLGANEMLQAENTLREPRRADRHFRIRARWTIDELTNVPRLSGTVTPINHAQVSKPPARDRTDQNAAEPNLRVSAGLLEHVSDAIIAMDVSGRITSWNPAAKALYGWDAGEAIGRLLVDLLDGDVEGRGVAELIRRQADARYCAAMAALDEGVLIVGVNDTVETANPAAMSLLGCPSLVGARFSAAVTLRDELGEPLPSDLPGLRDARDDGSCGPPVTVAVRHTGGTLIFLQLSIRALPSETGEAPYPVVVCILDVTDQHAAAALLRYEARHDQMTGLANRQMVLETITDLVQSPATAVGVLFIDLDRFKMVNDSLGHDAGDAVLRTIARRLADETASTGTVGRLAGDEFVLVVPDPTVRQMKEQATRLLARLSEPVRILDREIVVTCSIGVVVTEPGAGRGAGGRVDVGAIDVLRDADVAMYYAKQHGRNRVAAFDDRFRRRAVDRLALQEDLRNGLEHGEVSAAFQPVIALDRMRTAAVEALARWTHPGRGVVSPTVFIPIAEETGLIAPLGRIMFTRAIEQLATWRRTGGTPDLVVSVNLSPRQLADPQVADRVAADLQAYGLPAESLILEITETALMDDPELAAKTLTRLRDLGVGVSVDDFGTGYSSLSYLRRFPVTSVKIDRTFVESLGQTQDDVALVAGIINLGHTLGLTVVAEGVEQPEQLHTLTALGCDFAQGFLFSEPLAADLLTPLLRLPARPGLA